MLGMFLVHLVTWIECFCVSKHQVKFRWCKMNIKYQQTIRRKAYQAYALPPKIQRLGYLGIYIHLHNYNCTHISVNPYVTIILLPLLSDFISIKLTLFSSADL